MTRIKKFVHCAMVSAALFISGHIVAVKSSASSNKQVHIAFAQQQPAVWFSYYWVWISTYAVAKKSFIEKKWQFLPQPLAAGKSVEQVAVQKDAIVTAEGKLRQECWICGKKFKFLYEMLEHLINIARKISNDPLICRECGHECYSEDTLAQHIRLKHKNQGGGYEDEETQHQAGTSSEIGAVFDSNNDGNGVISQQNFYGGPNDPTNVFYYQGPDFSAQGGLGDGRR